MFFASIVLIIGVIFPTEWVQESGTQLQAQPKGPVTDAEKIASSRRSLQEDKAELAKIKKDLDSPTSDYRKAESDFQQLDQKYSDLKKKIEQYTKENMVAELNAATTELKSIEENWKLAKERFNTAIEQRKVMQEKVEALNERIATTQKMLDELEGKTPPVVPKKENPTKKDPPAKEPVTNTTASKLPTNPLMPSLGQSSNTAAPVASDTEEDDRVIEARKRLEMESQELATAESKLAAVEARIKVISENMALEQRLLDTEQQKISQAEEAINKHTEQLRGPEAADPDARTKIFQLIDDAKSRLAKSREEMVKINERLTKLRQELEVARGEQKLAAQLVATERAQVAQAEKELNQLLNPLTVRNITRWIMDKGPSVLGVLLVTLLLLFLVRYCTRYIVTFVSRHNQRGSFSERENRAMTLVGVVRYTATTVILITGSIVLLDTLGVPIVPLMGGAAVLGLAIAFGAQNLIRDYFTGFMILLEDQYGIGDIIKIGSIAGVVERITLRITVLRDLEGVLHFIPHGSITNVSNLTHGWSRALFDIPISYSANVDHIISVLKKIAEEARYDPDLGPKIIEDMEMLGVEEFAESAVIIRFVMKTRPVQQWNVKREMLRRIKNKFDQLGIEIPFNQITVHTADKPTGFEPHPGHNRTNPPHTTKTHQNS
ncbi:MAG: mechanosensitive ion channel [Zavarzinella sp.]